MSSTRTIDLPRQLQEVHNVLTTHLDCTRNLSDKTITLVLGLSGLTNNQFVKYLTDDATPANAVAYLGLTPMPGKENHLLCECSSLAADGLSDAANVAASYTAEMAVKRTQKVSGAVVVIPEAYLIEAEDHEKFTDLMDGLSRIINHEWLVQNALQVVVFGENSKHSQAKIVEAYDLALANLIRSTEDTLEMAQLFRPHGDLEASKWPLIDFLKAMDASPRPIIFANTANPASRLEVLNSIQSLPLCTSSNICFNDYHQPRSNFDEALNEALTKFTQILDTKHKLNQPLNREEQRATQIMGEFLTRSPVIAFEKAQAFLSAWGASCAHSVRSFGLFDAGQQGAVQAVNSTLTCKL